MKNKYKRIKEMIIELTEYQISILNSSVEQTIITMREEQKINAYNLDWNSKVKKVFSDCQCEALSYLRNRIAVATLQHPTKSL
jgi:hypothetical protein